METSPERITQLEMKAVVRQADQIHLLWKSEVSIHIYQYPRRMKPERFSFRPPHSKRPDPVNEHSLPSCRPLVGQYSTVALNRHSKSKLDISWVNVRNVSIRIDTRVHYVIHRGNGAQMMKLDGVSMLLSCMKKPNGHSTEATLL